MRKRKAFLATMILWGWFSVLVMAQQSYNELRFPPLRDIRIPAVEPLVLENGMVLYLLEDHELPLIQASALIGTGSVFEPGDKIGLAAITGEVMRTGGSLSMPGEKMDEVLESLAASVETAIGKTSGSASFSTMKENCDTTLSIFADVLLHPAFPNDKIQLAKVQAKSEISRRNDDPMDIASREFRKLIFGSTHPYGRHSEYATIEAITQGDLKQFHQQYYKPENVILGVWGDFNKAEMKKKIEAAFAEWTKTGFQRPSFPTVDYAFDATVNLARKADMNQAYLILGHLGGKKDNPDYYALEMMSSILGGSSTSRVFRNVRSRMGLAYSAFGLYRCDYENPGIFYVGCQTKAESTMKALQALQEEIKKISQALATDAELQQAKDEFLNSYVFHFDTKGEIVTRLMTYNYYGYPKDFLQKTKENIEKVTKDDVLRVAKTYLHSEQLRILAVGNPDLFDASLSQLGPVKEIDIAIPESH